MLRKYNFLSFLFLISAALFVTCTTPVIPEFELKEGLVFIEGFASTTPGTSFVTINESALEFGFYAVNSLSGAEVSFENLETGVVVPLTENEEIYLPPSDFTVTSGESWKLNVRVPDGRSFESEPEIVLEPVPISNLEVDYNPELEFRESFGGIFVPGHEAFISLEDPVADKNFYYWTFRTYENLDFCAKCTESIFRDGECVIVGDAISGFPYFFYPCETDCWRIRYPESIAIFDDKFSNGKSISKISIGNMLLYTKENMVLEVRQLSLTPEAFDYYKVLKDIVDNSSGLNAPPPAALIGNLFNPADSEDFIFGRFTAAATSIAAVFIDRSKIVEKPIEFDFRQPMFEPSFMTPFPPPVTIDIPCLETPFRTAIRPALWQD